jgi:hypothetical protein
MEINHFDPHISHRELGTTSIVMLSCSAYMATFLQNGPFCHGLCLRRQAWEEDDTK